MIPIALINRDKSIWGEDAAEFKWVLLSILFSTGYHSKHQTKPTQHPQRPLSSPITFCCLRVHGCRPIGDQCHRCLNSKHSILNSNFLY